MLATASLKTEGQFDWVYWPLFQGSIIYQHQTDSANPEDTLLASQQSVNQLKIEKQIFKLIKSCCKREPEPTLQKALDYSTYLKNMNTLEASMKIFWISWKSKYAHLKDYDTITDPKAPPKRKADNSAYNLFNQKFEELSKASNSGIWGGQIFAQAKVFKAPALPRRTDQLAAQQEVEDNKSFDQD
ncbi:hypothetical protein PSTG_12331 [Puccinia striiformis f. sp. tritici PST-78]|uniref:Uncharacterized protein n=1 Tax=Puccinia striiformis f. sp. tritici PST-78 TaxID=1165861 RepID=A0A0L0V532_9BASI|nr:hypothetical protein PSTG_12331 [Puccinia striiformis f. sp. tritici PST-78]